MCPNPMFHKNENMQLRCNTAAITEHWRWRPKIRTSQRGCVWWVSNPKIQDPPRYPPPQQDRMSRYPAPPPTARCNIEEHEGEKGAERAKRAPFGAAAVAVCTGRVRATSQGR